MNSKEYWGLAEAYSKVYAPQEIDEASAQGGRVTGSSQTTFKTTPSAPGSRRGAAPVPSSSSTGSVTSQRGRVTGSSSNNAFSQAQRSGGTRRGAAAGVRGTSTTSTPAAKPTPTPVAKPAPTPTVRPAASAPTSRPAASTTPTKPAASSPTKSMPTTGSGYKKDTSITDMIGRSQVRQGAPINTGNKSSDIRAMAARSTAGATPTTSPKSTPTTRPMGSKKPGSIVSGLDMFDLVKGHLLDEGYADTEEAAIAIMANMSEEWRESILSEAPGEWFGGLRDKARASRAAQMQSTKPTPKPGPTVSSPFAKPASRNDSGRLTTYGAGGGAAAERGGKTRSQVMQQGAKNLENKNRNPGPNFGR